ncbi:MAG: hypothetical protein Kow0022_04190 [Phycisphaerales bacterium]
MNQAVRELEQKLAEVKKQLAAARAAVTPEPVEDFALIEATGAGVHLSELFGDRRELIVIHNMGKRCVYCTLWADGFVSLWPHIQSRAAMVLASPDPPDVVGEFARTRGWPFRCVSTAGSGFSKAMGFEHNGSPMPGVSAFVRRDDGAIFRTGCASFGPGDEFCAIWHLWELLPGDPLDWAPRYSY